MMIISNANFDFLVKLESTLRDNAEELQRLTEKLSQQRDADRAKARAKVAEGRKKKQKLRAHPIQKENARLIFSDISKRNNL